MMIALHDTWGSRDVMVREGHFPDDTDLSPFVMFAIAYANENHVPQMRILIDGYYAVEINYGHLHYTVKDLPKSRALINRLAHRRA